MKVIIVKTMKDMVDSYIDEMKCLGKVIARIELSNGEFNEFFRNLKEDKSIQETSIEMNNCYFERGFCGYFVKSGSYIVYRDVCIQHHSSYESGDLGVEYI